MEQNASVAHSRLRATEFVVKVTSSGAFMCLTLSFLRVVWSCSDCGGLCELKNDINGLMFETNLQKVVRNVPGEEEN